MFLQAIFLNLNPLIYNNFNIYLGYIVAIYYFNVAFIFTYLKSSFIRNGVIKFNIENIRYQQGWIPDFIWGCAEEFYDVYYPPC